MSVLCPRISSQCQGQKMTQLVSVQGCNILLVHVVLAASVNGLYRVFSTGFAKGITKATDLCPSIQKESIESQLTESFEMNSRGTDLFFETDFDPEASTIPTCTFHSKVSRDVLAVLVGGFLSYNISWDGHQGIARPTTCAGRIKLDMDCKASGIVIPRILCGIPYRSYEPKTIKGYHLRPTLWIYSSGDFGITFPGNFSSTGLFSRNWSTARNSDKPLLAHLIFKMLIGNNCSIRVEQYKLTSRPCDKDVQLPFGCFIYNCSHEERIFDEIHRITDLMDRSESGSGISGTSLDTKDSTENRDPSKSQWNSGSANGPPNPGWWKFPRMYRWMHAWVPCAIIWCAILVRKQRNKSLSRSQRSQLPRLIVPIENRLEVVDFGVGLSGSEDINTGDTRGAYDKDLPPTYESLRPPSYAEAVGKDSSGPIMSHSTYV